MIEHLPLELFGNADDDQDNEDEIEEPVDEAVDPSVETGDTPEITLVSCHWCAEQYDDRLAHCPGCGVVNHPSIVTLDDPDIVTCQWCQASFAAGPERCPACDARVLEPDQRVLGEDDEFPDFAGRGALAQRAQSHQLLVGMMAGGTIDNLAAGLIGLVLTLLDDD